MPVVVSWILNQILDTSLVKQIQAYVSCYTWDLHLDPVPSLHYCSSNTSIRHGHRAAAPFFFRNHGETVLCLPADALRTGGPGWASDQHRGTLTHSLFKYSSICSMIHFTPALIAICMATPKCPFLQKRRDKIWKTKRVQLTENGVYSFIQTFKDVQICSFEKLTHDVLLTYESLHYVRHLVVLHFFSPSQHGVNSTSVVQPGLHSQYERIWWDDWILSNTFHCIHFIVTFTRNAQVRNTSTMVWLNTTFSRPILIQILHLRVSALTDISIRYFLFHYDMLWTAVAVPV